MKLYRLMKRDDTGTRPMTGQRYGTLGVRVPKDIAVDTAGLVHPGRDGMSTFDRPLVPDPKHANWVIDTDDLVRQCPELTVVESETTPGRYHVIPGRSMSLDDFQDLLAATQDFWEEL